MEYAGVFFDGIQIAAIAAEAVAIGALITAVWLNEHWRKTFERLLSETSGRRSKS